MGCFVLVIAVSYTHLDVYKRQRLYKVNPDNALERTNQKFIRRFNYIEQEAKKKNNTISDMVILCMSTNDPTIVKFSGEIKQEDLAELVQKYDK